MLILCIPCDLCCRVWQCVAVCCSVWQCVAVCCSVLQCLAVRCSVLQCAAVYCSMLQHVAVCCSVLQFVAVCFGSYRCGAAQCRLFTLLTKNFSKLSALAIVYSKSRSNLNFENCAVLLDFVSGSNSHNSLHYSIQYVQYL